MPPTASGRGEIVCFLDGEMGQADLAEACVRKIPSVVSIRFSGHSRRTIMFVRASRFPSAGAQVAVMPEERLLRKLLSLKQTNSNVILLVSPNNPQGGHRERGELRPPPRLSTRGTY
jgi:hypothetical protein